MSYFEIFILIVYYLFATGFMVNAWLSNVSSWLKFTIIGAMLVGWIIFPLEFGYMLYNKLNKRKKEMKEDSDDKLISLSKACEWLKTYSYTYYHLNEDEDGFEMVFDQKRMIEQFKKAMEEL